MALDPINSAIFNIADMIGLNSKSTKPADVGFNLSEFKANISKHYGIAKTSLFLVNMFPTSYLGIGYRTDKPKGSLWNNHAFNLSTEKGSNRTQVLSFFCAAANLPGLKLDTSSTRRYGIGPTSKLPISFSYPDLNLLFYGDNSGYILNFFRDWMNSITMNNFDGPSNADNITPNRGNVQPREGASKSLGPFEFGYPSDVAFTIEIHLFDPDSRRFLTTTFLDAYPVAVGDVNLSWGNHDDFMKIPVSLTFTRMFHNYELYPAPRPSSVNNLSLLQKLIKVGTVAQTLATMKKPRSVADVINLVNNASIAGGGIASIFRR